MEEKFKKLLLIDGSYMLHRGLNVPSIFDTKDSEGQRIGGVTQFFKSLYYEMKQHYSYFPVVVFDHGLSDRRLQLYPNYKCGEGSVFKKDEAEKDEYLEAYATQRDLLIDILKSFGIPAIRISGFEGDDILYFLTKLTKDVIIVSDDKDFLQLVSENVKISRPLAGEFVTEKSLMENNLSSEICLIKKCIMGDRSDNIPNVAKGLGDKNAERIARIVSENKDNYLEILSSSDKKQDVDFANNHDNYLLNRKLIDLKEAEADFSNDVVEIINNELFSTIGKNNYFKATSWLGKFDIKDVDVDLIFSHISLPKKHFFEGE